MSLDPECVELSEAPAYIRALLSQRNIVEAPPTSYNLVILVAELRLNIIDVHLYRVIESTLLNQVAPLGTIRVGSGPASSVSACGLSVTGNVHLDSWAVFTTSG